MIANVLDKKYGSLDKIPVEKLKDLDEIMDKVYELIVDEEA